ncbi:hypothetical protein DMH03_36625 [Amycolatopsis sp. WAC 01376]|uniref:LppU/SCO3897 family protein n=1 Tax=Amycolatopsis sp. WAC 01376 TaxID=2203195 RepID=UPI000F7BB167|nr:hypothetical protein [Amycolatopsis sp. WAC 01376]RSM54354.1 hypothetical protein DMH03_36625 [Amycolatopsis sp. WAC 01376]
MSENPGAPFPPQNVPQQQQWPQQQWPQHQGWPQQPPKKKRYSKKLQITLLVLALVVAVGGFAVIVTLNNIAGPEKQAKALTEGDCVVLTGSGKEADAVKTPCDSPQAPYAVSLTGVDKGDWNCKDGFYKYAVPRPVRGDGVALCLAINAKVGLCFDDIETKTPPPLKDCGSARLRISEVFPQMSVVNSPCAEGTAEVISYASYGTSQFKSATICFVKP